MRSVRPLVLGPVVLLLLAACTSTTPGWTYAPAPSATPLPSQSADASAAPSGEPSAAPSGEPSAAPSGEPSGEPSAAPSDGGGTVVDIAALNIAFDQSTLSAPADQPFQIRFANNDPGIPHNVEIKDSSGASQFTGEIFNGVDTRTYDAPGLPAGEYQFLCTVHPNMTGTLTTS